MEIFFRASWRRLSTLLLMLVVVAVFVSLFHSPGITADHTSERKTVLLLDSFHSELPWSRLFHKGFLSGLTNAEQPPLLLVEYMDASRFPGQVKSGSFVTYLEKKYAGKKIDLIVPTRRPASMLLAAYPHLFPDVPRLFFDTVQPDVISSFDQMVAVARPKRVVVIGETVTPGALRKVKRLRDERPFVGSVAVDFLLDLPMDELLRQVESLPPDTAIFYTLIFRDGAGQNFVPYNAAQQISQHASAPVFSHWDSLLGSGIVGGYVLSATRVGEIAARDILTTLLGGAPADPSAKASQAFGHIYDWRALERFDITLSQLPANSEVLHRQPSLLMEYRPYINGAGVLALLFGTLASLWIAILRRHRNHLEELVAQRTNEVQEKATQLEAALKREKEYSALQQKFVSLVSHEFRTPLTIIDGAAQRLVRSKKQITPETLRDKSEKIRSAVGRMTDLIENTLYAARLEENKIELTPIPINLGDLVRETCSVHGDISPDHDIRVDVMGLPSTTVADEKLLGIVFTNLLSNAVKFASNSPLIEVKGWTDGKHVVVSVADHGVGIPEDELTHMFDRFFRAKTAQGIKGTGIGLNVSKEFVEMHGGTIEVASVEGEGATFTVRLPVGDGRQ